MEKQVSTFLAGSDELGFVQLEKTPNNRVKH